MSWDDEKVFDITEAPTGGKVWTLNASISKPTNNWPAGSYHVDVYLDDQPVQSIKFSVQ